MTLPPKSTIKLGILVAAVIGASLPSQALPVTGTISFYGDVVATTSTAAGSPVVANGDFTQAGGLRFDLNQFVAANPSGAFASVIPNTVASLFPVLKINGPAIPPGGAPLWTVTDAYGDAFVFNLTSLLEPVLTPHVMVLTGLAPFTNSMLLAATQRRTIATTRAAGQPPSTALLQVHL